MARRKPKSEIELDDPRYAKALAHPLRVRILAMLAERPASPVQLAQKLDATLGAIAYHVRTLHTLDLIDLVETRQRRGATEHVYKAVDGLRFADGAWGGLGPTGKQRMVGAALRQAGEFASGSAAAGGFDRAEAQLHRLALTLDQKGFEQLATATAKWLAEAQRIQEAAGKRLAKAAEPEPIDAGLVLLAFEAVALSDQAPEAAGTRARRRPGRRSANSAG